MSSQVTHTCEKPTSAVRSAACPPRGERNSNSSMRGPSPPNATCAMRTSTAVLAHDPLEVAALPVLLHHDLHAERVAPERQRALEVRDGQAGVVNLCHTSSTLIGS